MKNLKERAVERMTKQEIENLNLGISPIDSKAELIINAGVEWLADNTTIDTTAFNDFPSSVKLFLVKFYEIQKTPTGVTSESIEGLSHSFSSADKNDLIMQFADELLGKYLVGKVRFVNASPKWG